LKHSSFFLQQTEMNQIVYGLVLCSLSFALPAPPGRDMAPLSAPVIQSVNQSHVVKEIKDLTQAAISGSAPAPPTSEELSASLDYWKKMYQNTTMDPKAVIDENYQIVERALLSQNLTKEAAAIEEWLNQPDTDENQPQVKPPKPEQ
jgi:hypothetical protein